MTTAPTPPAGGAAPAAPTPCRWHPTTAGDAPPACWVGVATARCRLAHGCAVLRGHGIAAHPALDGEPGATRVRLRAATLAAHPHSDGAYLFWTRHDDEALLTTTGELTAALTVHLDGPGVQRAARAAFESVGFTVTEQLASASMVIAPG